MLRNVVCSISLLFLLSACKESQPVSLLDEVSGVWKPNGQNTLVTVDNVAGKPRLVIDDRSLAVTLGTIDSENETINLTATSTEGKPLVWTLRRIWNPDHKAFHLMLTFEDGKQTELSFVRKISKEDLDRVAKLESAHQPGSSVPMDQAGMSTTQAQTEASAAQPDSNEPAERDLSLAKGDESFSTKVGVAKMVREGNALYGNLVLNDKLLLKDVMGASIDRRYAVGDQEIIVLNVSSGGNTCPVEYYFLTIKGGGKLTLSPSIHCHYEAELETTMVGNKIFATIAAREGDGLDKYEFDYETNVLLENGQALKAD